MVFIGSLITLLVFKLNDVAKVVETKI